VATGAPPFAGFERWDSTTRSALGFWCPPLPYPCLPKRQALLERGGGQALPGNCPTQAKNGLGWATEPFLNPHLSTGAPPFTGFERWISTTHPSLGFRCPRMPCPCLQKRETPALSLPKVTRGEATPTPRRNRRASYSKPGRVGILIFVFFSVPTDGPFKPVFGLEWGSSLVNPPRNLNSHFGKLGLHNFPGRSHR